MVGVGGRSKACGTCKSRHVRCDERRPFCSRCERGGFRCQGYERPIIFINAMPSVAHKRLVMSSSPESDDPLRPLNTRHEVSRNQSGLSSSELISASHVNSSGQQPASPSLSSSSPSTTGLAAITSRTLISEHARRFIHQLLTAQGFGQRLNQISHCKSGKRPPVLESSIEAAALILHGRLTQNTLSVYQATKLFGMALQQLRTQLAHGYDIVESPVAADASLLVAIMNMTLFEWVAGSTRDAWKQHVRGLAALIELCGPGAFRHETMRQAFEQARAHIMVLHMDESQRTFLEEPCWQQVPWSHDPGRKSFRGHFIDIICCIPGLLEDDRRLRELERASTHPTATDTCAQNRQQGAKKAEQELQNSMQERVIHLYTKLLDVRWRWELEHPNCCYEMPVLPRTRSPHKEQSGPVLSVDETTGRPIFDTVLFFNSLMQAIEMNFYHSCLLLLHSFARDLGIMDDLMLLHAVGTSSNISGDAKSAYHDVKDGDDGDHSHSFRLSPPFSFKTNNALVFPHEAYSDHYATRDILRTADFLLQPNHGPAGAYFFIFPLRIAQVYHELLRSLPDDDPRLNSTLPMLLDTETDGKLQEPRGSHIAGVPLDIWLDTSGGDDDLNSHIGHINTQVATQSRRPQAVQAASETEDGSLTKSKYHDLVTAWIQRIMRYMGDVQGFNITSNYN